jgi:Ca2+-transporting ATPase
MLIQGIGQLVSLMQSRAWRPGLRYAASSGGVLPHGCHQQEVCVNQPSPTGLSQQQARERLQADGPNSLSQDEARSWLAMGREVLSDPMFALLLGAGVLYLLLGEWQEGLVLFGLVVVVLALTLYQEGKTEHALSALRALSSPRAAVLRDAQLQRIAGHEVVRGDVLVLAEGDRIAADAVLLQGTELQVDESLLTGESMSLDKAAGDPLFSGTLLVRGHGLARVIATGARSEIGRIGGALVGLNTQPSPLRQQTLRLVHSLALLALVASLGLVLVYGLMHGQWLQAILAGIALGMALLPQEFSVVLTVLPALGAWRLSKHQVLTRRLGAIETLGAASVLCVDKTGTLTENRMRVAQLYAEPGSQGQAGEELRLDEQAPTELPETFHALVEYAILASVADPFDPMEKAFHQLGQQFLKNTEHLHQNWTLMQHYGLTPELRAMAHVWHAVQGAAHVVAAKGAPEAIVDLCHLAPADQARMAQAAQLMAAQGLRVLGVAQARFEGEHWPEQEHDFEFQFVGLLGLADPLRAEIPAAVQQAHRAGIRVLMITGDYPSTAQAIATQAGLASADTAEVLSGDEVDTLDDAALARRLRGVQVCARIAPTQKLRIVQALQAQGEVVAMTGDGVNDAPALKAAHVGVAMGQRGTDVAREAADLVLLNDNFAALVHAVRMGRRMFDNMRHAMTYILAVHVPIAGMALAPVLLGWPTLLFPLHIAFLELVIDPACSMVFENEPPDDHTMRRAPRDVHAPLIDAPSLWMALGQGLLAWALVMLATWWSFEYLSDSGARALAFTLLVATNLGLLLANRARHGALWRSLRIPNRVLWLVCAAALGLLLLALYLPWLASLFQFTPLPGAWLAGGLALGLSLALLGPAVRSNPTRPRAPHGGDNAAP